ncbi:putative Copper chaperone [Herminiimonas arsenicoxydans]|uniref:Copper chaperone n=1 Tax=Herminiimonas arsenicoxydans TaxID=204773 RepID=A4G2K8_HERAR|nr:putative Copper chaperone [Herminiimonas arsenicoxydans]
MKTKLFKVMGMTCRSCVARVSAAMTKVDGVDKVSVSLAAGEATVSFDESLTTEEELQEVLRNAGYGVTSEQDAKPKASGCCCA